MGGLWLAAVYGFVIGMGCEGSDAGQPPPAGSQAQELCDSPAFPVLLLALALAVTGAPVVGAFVAARRRRYAPLLGSAAAAAGALAALGLALHAVEQGSESVELFVGLPALVCACLAALAIRQGRSERPQ